MTALPQAAPRPASQLQGDSRATVLLVEDEAPVRAFASRALKLKGFDVLEASSGEDALEVLETCGRTVDIFVTDVVMPGLDGPAWVQQAKERHPQAAVIFMSGYTEDIFVEGRTPVADAAFLAKPFTLTELTQLVEGQLAANGSGGRKH